MTDKVSSLQPSPRFMPRNEHAVGFSQKNKLIAGIEIMKIIFHLGQSEVADNAGVDQEIHQRVKQAFTQSRL